MRAQRLLDQEGKVIEMCAWRRRYLAEEARADRTRALMGFAWGLGLSGLVWVALGLVFRRVGR